jgi:hypothetical protein
MSASHAIHDFVPIFCEWHLSGYVALILLCCGFAGTDMSITFKVLLWIFSAIS